MSHDFEDSVFETADGLRLHYRDYAPREPVADPVLCLHGLTRNLLDFEELAPRIAGLGRRVIVASQRGRGQSDRDPMTQRYNAGVYTADMLGLLDRLQIGRAVFVGTSMGGLMTMIAAAQAPERLAGAVLNDIGPEVDPRGLERIRRSTGQAKIAADWTEAAAHCRATNGLAFPRETGERFWDAFAHRVFRETGPGRIELDYDLEVSRATLAAPAVANLWPLFDALGQIPTLVVRGELSDLLEASTVDDMRRRKPDLEAVTVPGVGHAPFLTEPAAWDAVASFLARQG